MELDVNWHENYDDVDEPIEEPERYYPNNEIERGTVVDVFALHPFIKAADGEAWDELYEVLERHAAKQATEAMLDAAREIVENVLGGPGDPDGVEIEIEDNDE